MTKQNYAEALEATANKYLKPFNQFFFVKSDCPICVVVEKKCNMCPLNVPNDYYKRVGCIHRPGFKSLDKEMSVHIVETLLPIYLSKDPTEEMIKRAAQLNEASKFILSELSDEEFENKDFKRIYPLVS